jgi:hypothetical protein
VLGAGLHQRRLVVGDVYPLAALFADGATARQVEEPFSLRFEGAQGGSARFSIVTGDPGAARAAAAAEPEEEERRSAERGRTGEAPPETELPAGDPHARPDEPGSTERSSYTTVGSARFSLEDGLLEEAFLATVPPLAVPPLAVPPLADAAPRALSIRRTTP